MHLKSCPKLLRSELRLDLGHQQGAPPRRGHSPRIPLAALSTNTLRCGPVGGAAPARPKGSENAAIAEEDVWSVIRPGHVREKIALFAPDSPHERNAKCSWDVTAKRRRRTSYIALAPPPQSPPCAVTLTLQPAPPSVPQASPPSPQAPPPSENTSPLSVVEMVAFLEQRIVTSSPHTKLRSSASITLSRAPPLPVPPLVPVGVDVSPAPSCPADQPVVAPQGEEPESVSVSDMVAKLESQCLRREKQTERRTVGRVLLAEQKQRQPISTTDPLQATPTPTVATETRKEFVSFYKSDKKLKVTSCFSTDAEAKATPILPKRSDAIGRGRAESPPSSCQSKDKSSHTKVKREQQKTAVDLAAILRPVHAEVVSAKLLKTEEEFSVKDATETDPKPEESSETVDLSSVTLNTSPPSEFKSEKSAENPRFDEPLPGLLFLTPPSNVSVLSQRSKPHSPASLSVNSHSDSLLVLSTSELVIQSEPRTEERHHSSSNSDSLIDLSLDLMTHCSLSANPSPSSTSDQSEKRKRQCSQNSASVCDSSPIKTGSQDLTGQSEQRKAKSDSNLSRSCLNFVIQSETSKSSSVQSERSCLTVTRASLDQTSQSLNSGASFSQSEKRKSCPVTASELSVQSEASIELLPLESQSQRRRLNRIAQSEKRRSCPVMVSDWSNSQDLSQLQTLKATSDTSQSEQRLLCGSDQSEARPGGSVLRSVSDVGSERRRRRKCARAFSMCEGAGRVSEDFLLMRRRVQSLLEPRTCASHPSLLSLLPHHLLLQILLLLPTRALAALKCTCHYLRLVIDTYDPRPLDALWVCDPRYRDDPCKQCKRRHRRGDVSLCRWHHKPFCQAMPYGPGYWMCCHGKRRDTPGCNVGLHDNRWVPAHHSINAPIYRQRPREEDET